MVRTSDHFQIPYFDTKTKVPDAHSGEGVGGLGGHSHSPGKVLVVLSPGPSPVRRDKYLPPPLV